MVVKYRFQYRCDKKCRYCRHAAYRTVPPVSTDSLPKDLSTKRRSADSVTPQRGEGGGRMMRNTEGTVHLWLWAV